MKRIVFSILMMAACIGLSAQCNHACGHACAKAPEVKVQLPAPNLKVKSQSVVKALATRHSTREFAETKLTDQELSNLCWAACGVARDETHRTAPTARNKQEIRLFVFTAEGVFEYDAQANVLIQKAKGDYRQLIAGTATFKQDFVLQAPVSLLMVIDFDKFGSSDEKAVQMGCVDAGNVSENINLYCQSVGLVTVPRATHDTQSIRALLRLTNNQLPIMNNPVGHPKK